MVFYIVNPVSGAILHLDNEKIVNLQRQPIRKVMKKYRIFSCARRYAVVIMLFMFVVGECRAQDETRPYHWRGYMQAGLNTDGWEAHFGIAWMSTPYTGVAASIGFAGEIQPLDAWCSDYYDTYDSDEYCTRLIFKPSVILRTPTLFRIRSIGGDFCLFLMPGLTLAPPAAGSRNSAWAYWRAEGGLLMNFDRYGVSLTYSYSNFMLFDGNPKDFSDYNPKYKTHSVCLNFSIAF